MLPIAITLFSFLTIPIVSKFNRRTLFLTGAALCSLGHLVCCASLDDSGKSAVRNWIFNAGVLVYVGAFNSTFGVMT